ncbi:nickel/cobalt efflux transporter [Paludibacterium yongneupense]|uniref:nickel/cobalt efflux transporter n=1 Tax=Paludibacterium yongneupense TaxID=400061 RepID=UPI0004128C54|nr:nickel/cobalt efflux transporter [Paludibacterium yongneupense]
MPPIAEIIQQGAGNAWLFIPSAILLGALHGLEPGHSKTMMASFIIAIRGTIGQAVVLGLCAALSHSLIVWVLAMAALRFGNHLIAQQAEPYFMLVSASIVIIVASWMWLRTWRDNRAFARHALSREHAHAPGHAHDHDHDHHGGEYQDAHERAHAAELAKRFDGRPVGTGQIALFGLSGGLMPCPASVTILLICLQLKQFSLGVAMVASFSFGLACSLVAVGVIAAWGARHLHKRFGSLSLLARKMPYFSSALMMLVGGGMGVQGLIQIV